jgi:aminopeptidase N
VRLAKTQFDAAANMTDALAALTVLVDIECPEREAALAQFYERWVGDDLVVDKWFSLQARSSLPETLDHVRTLTGHPAFTRKNPNRINALVGAFGRGNQLHLHRADGAGYVFIADEVLTLDPLNPTTAARLAEALCQWRRFDPVRQALMQRELGRILAASGLSKNTYEIVSKSLASSAH